MEFLIVIAGIWLLFALFGGSSKDESHRTPPRSSTQSTPHQEKQPPETFRPAARSQTNSGIKFKTSASNTSGSRVPAASNLEGLHDAFTGAPLDKKLGLHQCQSCKVYYHTESLQVLLEANNSQCVSCQSTNIIAVVASAKSAGGKDYKPTVVTLENYKEYEGAVVTFEGRVHKVNESRRGNDFAVMFENKSWVRGFKLVFFRGAVHKVGGRTYINSLEGRKVKVRGLVIKHPRFGYEIIVSEKSMILDVK